MKLSEAIRLGAMLKPQAHGRIDAVTSSCALGAAADALGMKPTIKRYVWLSRQYQFLLEPAHCSRCHALFVDCVMDMIYHLNDSHGWTRERIADWVETLEAAQEREPSTSVAPDAPVCASVHR